MRELTSVRTSGREQAQTLERMLEPKLRSPAQDSVLAVLLHRMRVRQPVRALVRLGHLLPPQALSAAGARTAAPSETAEPTAAQPAAGAPSGTAEQTAVPIAGPPAAWARTAALSGTAGQTAVPIAAQTAVQTVAPGRMRSVLIGVPSTTAT